MHGDFGCLFFIFLGYILKKVEKDIIVNKILKGDLILRQLTSIEVLSLAKLLEMESNSLAVAQASLIAISDEKLKNMAQASISAQQARIAGLQQFITENNITAVNANFENQTQTSQGVY